MVCAIYWRSVLGRAGREARPSRGQNRARLWFSLGSHLSLIPRGALRMNWTTALVLPGGARADCIDGGPPPTLPKTYTLVSQSLAVGWPMGGILPIEQLSFSPGQPFREQDSWEPLVANTRPLRAAGVWVHRQWKGSGRGMTVTTPMVYCLWPYVCSKITNICMEIKNNTYLKIMVSSN